MSKQCKKCGAYVPNEYAFCNMCGSAEFIVAGAQPQVNAGQPQPTAYNNAGQSYGYQQMPGNQPLQYAAPQNSQPTQPYQYGQVAQQPKKKKKTGLIIGIIIALVIGAIVFGIIGLAVIGACVAQDETSTGSINNDVVGNVDDYADESEDNSYESNNKKEITYTKGTFDGLKYVNEWADIEFVLPEGYTDADYSLYSASENESTECGGYFISKEKGSFIYFAFEEIPKFSFVDEEDYIEVATKNYTNELGPTCKTGEIEYRMVAGCSYAKVRCEFTASGQDFVNDLYVRKVDNYMVVISAVSLDGSTNNVLVSKITKAN